MKWVVDKYKKDITNNHKIWYLAQKYGTFMGLYGTHLKYGTLWDFMVLSH